MWGRPLVDVSLSRVENPERRNGMSRQNSLALWSAYECRRHWIDRLASAQSVGEKDLEREAGKFIAQYAALIAEIEKQEKGG